VLETVHAVAHKVRRFLLIRTVLGVISGAAVTAWLWFMGVDFAPFWGVLFFLLNYVPNIGSIIAGIPPTLLAFVQFGPGWALLVAGGLLAMEQVTGNFLDPHLQGRTLNVSSLVVLLSVILWGWIWGVPGALIAVPLTVTIILVCAKVPMLRPIAVLLSGGENIREADHLRD
jgi:AI-2 transport protein TqsA